MTLTRRGVIQASALFGVMPFVPTVVSHIGGEVERAPDWLDMVVVGDSRFADPVLSGARRIGAGGGGTQIRYSWATNLNDGVGSIDPLSDGVPRTLLLIGSNVDTLFGREFVRERRGALLLMGDARAADGRDRHVDWRHQTGMTLARIAIMEHRNPGLNKGRRMVDRQPLSFLIARFA